MAFATFPSKGGAGTGDVVGPLSSTNNGIVLFDGTSGKLVKDGGVGSANQVLVTDGTTPSFALITNANIDASAAIDFSKLASLTSGNILVGSAGNVATSVAMTGDVTISNTGVTAISSGVIVDADVNASAGIVYSKLNLSSSIVNADIASGAAIAYSKLATLTASRALESSGTGVIQVSAVTSTELGYVSGVTSAIQTQIDSKEPTISLTINRAVISDGSGGLAVSATTSTEIGYVSGVTSAIQTQINGKVSDTGDTMTGALTIDVASNQLVLSSGVNQLTLNSGTSAAARTYLVPDVGTSADFVMTAGAQTIAGAKTFSDSVTLGSATDTPYTTYHTINKNLSSSTPGTANDADGGFALVANGYLGGGLQNARLTGLGGATLWLQPRTTDTSVAFDVRTNLAADSATTGSTTKFSITQSGAVTLGPAVQAGVNGVRHVINTGDQGATYSISSANAGTIQICNASTTTAAPVIAGTSNDVGGASGLFLSAYTNDGNTLGDMVFDARENDNTAHATTTNLAYNFRYFATTILSGTRAGAWTLGPTAGASVVHSFYSSRTGSTTGQGVIQVNSTGSGSAQRFMEFYHSTSTQVGGIERSGTSTTPQFFSGTSDVRLKTNIESNNFDALTGICSIPIYSYNMKDEPNAEKSTGPMAQDVEKYFPHKVADRGDGYLKLSMGYEWEFWRAIQQLNDKIEAIK